jgi:hypothetical protein
MEESFEIYEEYGEKEKRRSLVGLKSLDCKDIEQG